jgi:predicted branched-subunit amino acid permease
VLRDSLGVGVAVGVSGVAFGGTAVAAGLTVAQACALSLLAFTGASQYALIGAIAAGGNPLVGAAGALLLGARNAFYGLRLGQLLAPRGAARLAVAQVVIDESTAVTLAQPAGTPRRLLRLAFGATGGTVFVRWNATTLLGALGASAVGDPRAYGLDVAGPAAFLALLVPRLRDSRGGIWVAGLAVLLALGTTPLLPAGLPVLAAILAVPAIMLATRKTDRRGDRQDQADGKTDGKEVAVR